MVVWSRNIKERQGSPVFPDIGPQLFCVVRCHGNSTGIAEFLPILPEHSIDLTCFPPSTDSPPTCQVLNSTKPANMLSQARDENVNSNMLRSTCC